MPRHYPHPPRDPAGNTKGLAHKVETAHTITECLNPKRTVSAITSSTDPATNPPHSRRLEARFRGRSEIALAPAHATPPRHQVFAEKVPSKSTEEPQLTHAPPHPTPRSRAGQRGEELLDWAQ